jgi:hypothetical protein
MLIAYKLKVEAITVRYWCACSDFSPDFVKPHISTYLLVGKRNGKRNGKPQERFKIQDQFFGPPGVASSPKSTFIHMTQHTLTT